MLVSLTLKKKNRIRELCQQILHDKSSVIRDVAKLLGYFSSSFVAVRFGKLHYRNLERDKIEALRLSKGNFDALMHISELARKDIEWWRDNILDSSNEIYHGIPSITLSTDACNTGWGAVLDAYKTHGLFSYEERDEHINQLELRAILYGLGSLVDCTNSHIKILCDNTTSVFCINNMGSCKSLGCDSLAKQIWHWAIRCENWITASYIPGHLNEEADTESRRDEFRLEWKLKEEVFVEIMKHFEFEPDIDLFASRLNTQLEKFVSFRPDPEAKHVNAFTIPWTGQNVYLFPPFSCINRIVQRFSHESVSAVIIVPNWPNQLWYPCLMDMTPKKPFLIHHSVSKIYLPSNPQIHHPLKQLELMACLVLT